MTNNKEIWVCKECGSTAIESLAWADANTEEVLSFEEEKSYCRLCEKRVEIITLEEYNEQ